MAEASDILHELFHHHIWATEQLIDACAGLSAEQLRAPVPGTFGAILPTLTHLVGADQRYLRRFPGEPQEPTVQEGTEPPLATLRSRIGEQGKRWQAQLERLETLDVALPARGDWPETPHGQRLLCLQAIHHGNDHRTQVCTMLSVLGQVAPEVDGWHYWAARRIGTAG